jgi:hypothetical protein
VKILFDQGTPAPLRRSLPQHDVSIAFERGWHMLQNGELLNAGEAEGFDAIITTDQNIRYQQNLVGRRLFRMKNTTLSSREFNQDIIDNLGLPAGVEDVELEIPLMCDLAQAAHFS